MNKRIKDIIEYIIIIIVVLLFRKFMFSPIRVTGNSMVPTLRDGDIMILNKIGYSIKGLNRFDIVVINNDNEKIIKRVIGLPGEHVEYSDNKLYINSKLVEEPYERKDMEDFVLEELGENKIPEGKYLVLGDNRPISKDSRIIGLIDKKEIDGYTSIVVFPFKRIKNAK
ncbi:MAG: signal peptidase I [Bacilli bacterium]|nr:signal peptidase I [Bacilli bacterium]MBQ6282333.1 signal peptidase I [Bacilli bacterium]